MLLHGFKKKEQVQGSLSKFDMVLWVLYTCNLTSSGTATVTLSLPLGVLRS